MNQLRKNRYLDKNPDGYCHLSPELFEYAKQISRG